MNRGVIQEEQEELMQMRPDRKTEARMFFIQEAQRQRLHGLSDRCLRTIQ